ncbi:GNAT family N-acetyltransferase [Paenibacillus rhizovicinus]|uniref:GNAT family N-acetyltransferase n=1 Tax=Paenibacillus rhizovicinus TaxID=2704463 RepID=A0A6C0P096_9BACL|nr:GNAT family N-acetyltransferase [Paenibacillus rhizovicinus]QHW31636.1 GNAT family N-acetyltransferase [Paenibacillus rhizovicinus]
MMLTIRQATQHDLPKVVECSQLWTAENITYGLGPNSEEGLRSSIGDYFWIAEVDSDVIGYITGSVHESEGLAVIAAGERYLEIDEVYVHPEHRSGTIGHQLVDRLLQTAEGNGINRSIVNSASKQWREIVGFYEKHGFQMWFVQMYR